MATEKTFSIEFKEKIDKTQLPQFIFEDIQKNANSYQDIVNANLRYIENLENDKLLKDTYSKKIDSFYDSCEDLFELSYEDILKRFPNISNETKESFKNNFQDKSSFIKLFFNSIPQKLAKQFLTKTSTSETSKPPVINNFHIDIDGNYLTQEYADDLKEIIDLIVKAGLSPKITVTKINDKSLQEKVSYLYSPEEMNILDDLNSYLSKATGNKFNEIMYQETVRYQSDNEKWKHSQVKKANSNLNQIVNNIKKANLSPFETMIWIHKYASSFSYWGSDYSYEEEKNRVLLSSLGVENPYIVCVGYANLVKAIIDELDIPDLKCDLNSCDIRKLSNLKTFSGHANNIITIKDEKYNIDGVFMEDACWDCVDEKSIRKTGRGFANCLYPVNDVQHISDRIYIDGVVDNQTELNSVISEETKVNSNIKLDKANNPILKEPIVCIKYGDMSQPIPIKCFKDAYQNVLINMDNLDDPEKITKKIKTELTKSIGWAADIFDNQATNNFNSKNAKQILENLLEKPILKSDIPVKHIAKPTIDNTTNTTPKYDYSEFYKLLSDEDLQKLLPQETILE